MYELTTHVRSRYAGALIAQALRNQFRVRRRCMVAACDSQPRRCCATTQCVTPQLSGVQALLRARRPECRFTGVWEATSMDEFALRLGGDGIEHGLWLVNPKKQLSAEQQEMRHTLLARAGFTASVSVRGFLHVAGPVASVSPTSSYHTLCLLRCYRHVGRMSCMSKGLVQGALPTLPPYTCRVPNHV